MAATCGKCKAEGVSVAHVKACYAGTVQVAIPVAEQVAQVLSQPLSTPVPTVQGDGPTEKQAAFIANLREQRVLTQVLKLAQPGTRKDASKWIELALACPKVSKPAKVQDTTEGTTFSVPEGYYAVQAPSDTELRFYRVKAGKAGGKWAGFTFVDMQASDDWYPQKGARRTEILTAIAQDIAGAAKQYAAEIGSCYVCNKTLTDDESRALGIGPVCRKKGLAL
jgi:Family of unknown function (DUF6011)